MNGAMIPGMLLRHTALALMALLPLTGPAPVSFCALMMGLPADCAPAAPVDSHCDQMPMPAPAEAPDTTPDNSPDLSCCDAMAAPAPELNVKTMALGALVSLEYVSDNHALPPLDGFAPGGDIPSVGSPPDRQPLLCVFLI